jgi:alanyl-tRNA synthetase
MTAGIRAVRDARERYEIIRRVSGLLSVPKNEIDKGTERLLSELEALKLALKEERSARYLSEAGKIPTTDGNLVLHYENAGFDELKTLANALVSRVGGILVLLSGKDSNFKHLTVSKNKNLTEIREDMNKALGGRGGGKPEAMQGSFSVSLDKIKEYFNA